MPKTKLKVYIDADSAKFTRRMKALGATVAGIGVAIAAVGAASAVAFVRMASNVAKMNGEIGLSAKKLQLSNTQLQKLQAFAGLIGQDIGVIEGAFGGLSSKIQDAKDGMQGVQDEFALMGLSAEDFGGDTFNNFIKVLKGLESIQDKQKRLSAADILLSDDGVKMLAALSSGGGSLDKILSQIEKRKTFFSSDKEIENATKMNVQAKFMEMGMKKLKSAIASETFPAFESLVKSATNFINRMLVSNEFPGMLKAVKEAAEVTGTTLKRVFSKVDADSFIDSLAEIAKLLNTISDLMNQSGLSDLLGLGVKATGASVKLSRESLQGLPELNARDIATSAPILGGLNQVAYKIYDKHNNARDIATSAPILGSLNQVAYKIYDKLNEIIPD